MSRLRLWLPVLVWASIIFILSGIPSLSTGLGTWDLILRKTAHMVEFGVLNVLLMRALYKSGLDLSITGVVLCSSVLSVLYAVSDEFHQAYVPGRSASGWDVMFDGAGVVLSGVWYHRMLKGS